jgi:DNA-binding NarL/FixJ family response regulator
MKEEKISLLLVSSPGILQQTLAHTFGSKTQVDVKGVADGGLSALKLMKKDLPDLVVIDSNIPESETDELIQVIRKEFPGVHTLVLVETSQQFAHAAQSQADFVVRAYDTASRLDAVLLEMRVRLGPKTKNAVKDPIPSE